MNTETKPVSSVTETSATAATGLRRNAIKMVLSYQWIVNNIYYILFLALLTVGYIFNGHQADRTIRQINRTAGEIRQLEYEYKTLKSELMYKSREAELLRATQPMGLILTRTPHQRIPVSHTPSSKSKNNKNPS